MRGGLVQSKVPKPQMTSARVIDNLKLLVSLSNAWTGINELLLQAHDAIAFNLILPDS